MEIKRRLHKDKWLFKVLNSKEMRKVADGDEDCKGLCDIENKKIFIRDDSITYATVFHEIFHAYWSYLHLDDTNDIHVTDVEEIGANFFAAEGEEMIKKGKRITKELQKLAKEESED